MAEKISSLIQSVEKDTSSTPEQKEKAKEVLKILTKKNKNNLQINTEAREETLQILKEITLDSKISVEIIEWNLIPWEITEEKVANLPQDSADKVWEDLYEEFERQWWDKAYIFAKMLSLWYIPKFHDMKYQKEFSGQKVKWIWNNSRYFAMWWILTNWTVNTPFIEAQEKTRTYFAQLFIWEESQLRVLLKSVKWADTIWDRTIINERLKKLTNLKTAIESWSRATIKTASVEYANISESTGKIWDLFKKYWVYWKVKTELNSQKQIKEKAERETLEKENEVRKKEISDKLDEKIEAQEKEIEMLKNQDINQEKKLKKELRDLESDKTKFSNEKVDLENDKIRITSEKSEAQRKYDNTVRDINTELKAKTPNTWVIANLETEKTKLDWEISRLTQEIQAKETEISRKSTEIRSKESDITKKQVSIDDFEPSNTKKIKDTEAMKKIYTDLQAAHESWDYKKAKLLLEQYERKHGNPLELEAWKNHETFMSNDQKTKIKKDVKSAWGRRTPWEWKKVMKKEVSWAIDSEIKSITSEIQKIDDEITKIKSNAEKKLKELNNVASKDPKKVPELRTEIEKLTWEMNQQITDLEWKWVTKLQKLNPDDLKLLATNSKWTQRMINANGWIDKLLSWKTWIIVWVWAIILLTKWVYDGTSKDGFSKESALNVTDIWIGMIPIAGWIYDIWMSIKWTDLNGKEMQNSERWMRFWFWVVWLVPLVWTAVKWASTWVKATNAASKLAQSWELITNTWLVTWKIAWVWALWYGGITTVTYTLPSNEK